MLASGITGQHMHRGSTNNPFGNPRLCWWTW